MLKRIARRLRLHFDRFITRPQSLNYVARAMNNQLVGNEAVEPFSTHGWHCLRKHFYVSLPDDSERQFRLPTDMPGVRISEEDCDQFYRGTVQPYVHEFQQLPLDAGTDSNAYHVVNGTFMAVDGQIYYGILRSKCPARIVEIGSGNSTRLASLCIERNLRDGKQKSSLTCIEPFAGAPLRSLPHLSELIEKPVQACDLRMFESLQAGDILFIDSTHVVRPGGDVSWEICEILPRLAPGVLVHVHDIYLPNPYPEAYLQNQWHWMEQYMLQAFLAFNDRFRILWAGNWMYQRRGSEFSAQFEPAFSAMTRAYDGALPASLWMVVV